jgi:hypothetical protein
MRNREIPQAMDSIGLVRYSKPKQSSQRRLRKAA